MAVAVAPTTNAIALLRRSRTPSSDSSDQIAAEASRAPPRTCPSTRRPSDSGRSVPEESRRGSSPGRSRGMRSPGSCHSPWPGRGPGRPPVAAGSHRRRRTDTSRSRHSSRAESRRGSRPARSSSRSFSVASARHPRRPPAGSRRTRRHRCAPPSHSRGRYARGRSRPRATARRRTRGRHDRSRP